MKAIVNGRSVELEINSGGGGFDVLIDGKQIEIKVLGMDSSRIKLLIDNRPVEFFYIRNGDEIILTDSIREYSCSIRGRYQEMLERCKISSEGRTYREKVLKSPMPGLVTRVLVKPGSPVRIGDKLVILEAMKMENEIRSDFEGVVMEVLVEEGTAVEKDSPLLKISSN